VQQQLADAKAKLATTQADVERNRQALAGEAVLAYIHGGLTSNGGLRSFNGSVDLVVQQGYFQLATSNQTDALDQLRQSETALHEQQAVLTATQQDSQAAVASLASRQQAVQAASAASEATLNQVQGDLVQLVAQQQVQIAAQQQAQLQASALAAKAKLIATAPVIAPAAAAAAGPAAPTTAAPSVSKLVGPILTSPPTTKAPAPPPPAPAPSRGAAAAIAYAQAQIGKPYQWGGSGPGSFDCSGLTMRAWEAGGVSLPHYTAAQYANTAHVPIADLQPGDLVFFGSDLHHVGLYIGGGQMIDAPQTGEFVRAEGIFWPDLQPYGGRPS
jgi:cell wall-associated NlpC family hydrolase